MADILDLEFTKLPKHQVRFRKCGRCGRYFIMKGNYDTRYCGRIVEVANRICQDVAAQENYQKKTGLTTPLTFTASITSAIPPM